MKNNQVENNSSEPPIITFFKTEAMGATEHICDSLKIESCPTKREILFNAMRDGKKIRVTGRSTGISIGTVELIKNDNCYDKGSYKADISFAIRLVVEKRISYFWLSLVEIEAV